MDQIKFTYISNAGVLVEKEGIKILIDGFCSDDIEMYKKTPEDIFELIKMGKSPYDNINTLIFTHSHSDHFNLKMTCEVLENNNNIELIGTKTVVSLIEEDSIKLKTRCHFVENKKVLSKYKLDIVPIKLRHEGVEYFDVEHFGYIINIGGTKILNLGDASMGENDFAGLELWEENIEFLIVPFPFIATKLGRDIIKKANYISPQKILVHHFPHENLDEFGWVKGAKRYHTQNINDLPETILLEEIGAVVE